MDCVAQDMAYMYMYITWAGLHVHVHHMGSLTSHGLACITWAGGLYHMGCEFKSSLFTNEGTGWDYFSVAVKGV